MRELGATGSDRDDLRLRRPTAALFAGSKDCNSFFTSSSTTTIVRCSVGVISSARCQQADDTLVYEEKDPAGSPICTQKARAAAFSRDRRWRSTEHRSTAPDRSSTPPEAQPRLVAVAREEGVQYSARSTVGDDRCSFSPAPPTGCKAIDFKRVVTAAPPRARARQLARPRLTYREGVERMCWTRRALCRPHGLRLERSNLLLCPEAIIASRNRKTGEAALPPPSTRKPPIRSTPWAATTVRNHQPSGSPIRR